MQATPSNDVPAKWRTPSHRTARTASRTFPLGGANALWRILIHSSARRSKRPQPDDETDHSEDIRPPDHCLPVSICVSRFRGEVSRDLRRGWRRAAREGR